MTRGKSADRLQVNPGESAAVYCRISHAADEDQTGVDRQERICRDIAKRFGLMIVSDHVFVDNSRSAWQRKRKRPGWDDLIQRAERREFQHIIAYHPDRLMRQPRDLEELLQITDEHRIMLHGEANRRDLSDPDDRFILRIEVAHACRSSDDTSRRLKSVLQERAEAGLPVGGMRRFGYEKGGMVIREDEAVIVREVFDRFLKGEGPLAIARGLNERGIKTVAGKMWVANTIRTLLDSNHVAGIRVHGGEVIGEGTWPVIIDRGTFEEAQTRRQYQAARQAVIQNANRRFYLLRGLITCERCGTLMSGSRLGGVPSYMCTRHCHADERKCVRKIRAAQVEEFVTDAAITLLEKLTVSGAMTTTALPAAQTTQIEADQAQLVELNEMWTAREIPTPEYRKMRKAIEERINKAQRKTVLRPLKVLEGITGPNARKVWHDEATTDERRNAVLHFLFAAVRIGESNAPNGVFDWDRISVEQNPLS